MACCWVHMQRWIKHSPVPQLKCVHEVSEESFYPQERTSGKILLILDSHASHYSDVAVLDIAAENDVIRFSSKPHHPVFYLFARFTNH
ncbi:hypothetical protein TNIN_196891 [Trichonephila inaurata madagascariensis]|uniref:Uncharacterized protein n=1 Tax=Trichonephila inaurata madagascariensis TaxID=2747483 RepID=A0A8X7C3V8_9ARAC|nr:hypothetical protein TNIN_196891 [Trichonephila inaurata madagascariensis]